ncbi:MAG: hypothetical protein WDM78_23490 [Puia sp.]
MSQEVWLELGSADMRGLKEILDRLSGMKKIVRQGNHFQVYFFESIPDAGMDQSPLF